MFSAGGQVPTTMFAPASARDFAIANPNPPSSATPATRARLPLRSMLSIRVISQFAGGFTRGVSPATRWRGVGYLRSAQCGQVDNSRTGKERMRRLRLIAMVTLLPLCAAQGQSADTIYHKTPLITTKDLVMGAAFGVATVAVAPLDRYFAHRLQD